MIYEYIGSVQYMKGIPRFKWGGGEKKSQRLIMSTLGAVQCIGEIL